jgi:branched-subunit amino acid ABC-type transport system permease component
MSGSCRRRFHCLRHLGGYAGWLTYSYTGSFIAAVVAGSLFLMIVGVLIERVIIRHFYNRPHEDQLLVTFGLGIVFVELVRFFFGSLSKTVSSMRRSRSRPTSAKPSSCKHSSSW